jgi:hypothetical protein
MSTTCSICLDEIDVAATGVVTLCCGHQGHLGCISKWFYSQDKSSCPLCRKEIDGAGDVWVQEEEGEEEDEEEDDEDEDEDDEDDEESVPAGRFADYVSFNNAEFNTMMVEHGLRPVPADKWPLFAQTYVVMTPEFPNELRLRIWQYDLENIFLGRGEKRLTTEMWMLIVDRRKACITDAFLSATADFSHPLDLPLQPFVPRQLRMTLYLMDTGVWESTVTNPEEYTGIFTTRPAVVMSSATKIQAVWRGFKARLDKLLTVS